MNSWNPLSFMRTYMDGRVISIRNRHPYVYAIIKGTFFFMKNRKFCKRCLKTSWSLFPWNLIQVAQRATIAHLSPMCQGQISFQKTYKWAMETRGPKSNSSGLLCLSWLPATLMMIRSKMNKLAWRHHFPITGLWEIF